MDGFCLRFEDDVNFPSIFSFSHGKSFSRRVISPTKGAIKHIFLFQVSDSYAVMHTRMAMNRFERDLCENLS